MAPQAPLRAPERENWNFFLSLPDLDRRKIKVGKLAPAAGPAAAVRILRRLRRLRRNAVCQAADPALRRPGLDRQRHRLLVDLRRQPARPRPDAKNADGPRPGLVQLACSKTTPSSAWASGSRRQAEANSPPNCSGSFPPPSATTWWKAILRGDAEDEAGIYDQRERVRGAEGRSCKGSIAEARHARSAWPTSS